MDIFSYRDYKQIVNSKIQALPQKGRGQYKKIAEYLGVSSVLVSQVFKSDRDLSLEQGMKVSSYFGFVGIEEKYFLKLLHLAKAGTQELKSFYQQELDALRLASKAIENRVPHAKILSQADQGIFYSDWKFSALRLACELARIKTAADLSKYFDLDIKEVKTILDFLISRGMVLLVDGNLQLGTSSTHLSKASPFIKNHHRNWRLKALESIGEMHSQELMYSAPMSISKSYFDELNRKVLGFIDELVKGAKEMEEAEEVYYLNIDLRKI